MKHLFLAGLICTFFATAHAQVSVTTGLNLSKYSYPADPADLSSRQTIAAFNVGLRYRNPLSEKVSLQPELGFTQKGAVKYPAYPIGFTGPLKYVNRLSYLQLSLPAVASFSLSDTDDEGEPKFEVGAGPYVAGLVRAAVTIVEFDDSRTTTKYSIGSASSDAFRRLDYGLRAVTGFRLLRSVGIHIHYEIGFKNIESNPALKPIRNRNFSLNLSWMFGHTKN
ncbi:PorT family protein [Terrimonas sp. NA20]|uniref:PorT family protein n=1 Tax=Terrimonas ginsenosidimutans TaxID=2908004 RepID=A0ABS9KM13_9BACT|nr:porin family protein [Terrimonas ginsenosidimutans]MCG2613346.1 PorT family protein [Terrimonas ginsenosidimutans]